MLIVQFNDITDTGAHDVVHCTWNYANNIYRNQPDELSWLCPCMCKEKL